MLREGARFCDHCGASVSLAPTDKVDSADRAETLRDYDPLIGQTLDSKYELCDRLGEGGMGAVYRGRRVHIGDEVAVKVLLQKFVADAGSIERFRREARAAAVLRHQNVVAIYDYSEARGPDAPAYIVMELLDGLSLRGLLQKEGRLSPARAISLMRQICAGVGAAHRRDVFHRDLKPDNVIVLAADADRETETVKVVDFGIAKLRDVAGVPSLTQTGAVVGTPYYMSPEQCRGEPLDARSDVYSLGAMLYEMLAGAPPFMAETVTGVIAKHLFEPPPSLPRDIDAASIEKVIIRALAKNPGARQPDATAFVRELTGNTGTTADALIEDDGDSKADAAATRTDDARARVTEKVDAVQIEPEGGTNPKRRVALRSIAWAIILVVVGVGGAKLLGWDEERSSNDNNISRPSPQPSATSNGNGMAQGPTPPAGMVYAPGGEFTMGRNDSPDVSERPEHTSMVGPFFIDKYEVTRDEYSNYVRATQGRQPRNGGVGINYPGTARQPVTGVTWEEAKGFCEANGKRLPTEEEWEFAARGTDGRRYPWGNEWQSGMANANGARVGIATVGSYEGASPYGALDMAGNVWEWTASEMQAYAGGNLPLDLPPGNLKVIRGGSFESDKDYATATYRSGWPAKGAPTYDQTGFRCVKDVPR
jgi:serine/threonine-protein kinase